MRDRHDAARQWEGDPPVQPALTALVSVAEQAEQLIATDGGQRQHGSLVRYRGPHITNAISQPKLWLAMSSARPGGICCNPSTLHAEAPPEPPEHAVKPPCRARREADERLNVLRSETVDAEVARVRVSHANNPSLQGCEPSPAPGRANASREPRAEECYACAQRRRMCTSKRRCSIGTPLNVDRNAASVRSNLRACQRQQREQRRSKSTPLSSPRTAPQSPLERGLHARGT